MTITKFQLKQLFEEFNSKIHEEGITAKYSWFIYKNAEMMAEEYGKLLNSLYDERKEKDYMDVLAAQQELNLKYGEKNEDGSLITNPETGRPIFVGENAKKYEEEFMQIREKYKDFFSRFDNKNATNQAILSEDVTFTATQLELSEFPNNTKPFIIGILGY